jgi:peptide/nickel transport system ATP-binding protein
VSGVSAASAFDTASAGAKLLEVEHLSVDVRRGDQSIRLVRDVSFSVDAGRTLGIVGESGSGKSVSAMSLIRLLPPTLEIATGTVRFDGRDLATLTEPQLRSIRGREIGVVFQDPQNSLNPAYTIGNQLVETLRAHTELSRAAANKRAIELLDRVGIHRAAARMNDFPHQLSGGMAQRVMIALAISLDPKLLIADEPTTALDVTVQAQILGLLRSLQRDIGMGLLIISHDLSVIAETADDVTVMYGGEVVERGDVVGVLTAPTHEYTKALLSAQPSATEKDAVADRPVAAPDGAPLLRTVGLSRAYGLRAGRLGRRSTFYAVDDVSFDLAEGETLGVVGESGAGKSTVGRMVLGLTPPTRGAVEFRGADISSQRGEARRSTRRDIQVVFQNPYASLDPTMTIGESIAEPLEVHHRGTKVERTRRVAELLEQVGLDQSMADRKPYELSGGQRQRVAIARGLALNPKLIVCDEPVSALDVSTQAQVINLLRDLQARFGIAYLFVGHDLSVVYQVSDRIAVMYHGRIVEMGPAEQIHHSPRHPYTIALLGAVLSIDPRARRLDAAPIAAPGEPSPTGCAYANRCPSVMEHCRTVVPPLVDVGDAVTVRCHLFSAGDAEQRKLADGSESSDGQVTVPSL